MPFLRVRLRIKPAVRFGERSDAAKGLAEVFEEDAFAALTIRAQSGC